MELTYIPYYTNAPVTSMDILYALKDTATNNGVFADFFTYDEKKPNNPDSGLYFVVCADSEPLIDLKRHPEKLKDIIEYNGSIGNGTINPYYSTVKLPAITDENIFAIHNEMCQAIQNVTIVRNSFYEFGYKLPKAIGQTAIDAIYELYLLGHNSELPEHLQELYRKSYKKYVREMNWLYNKKSSKFLKTKLFNKHRVSADYFIKNHISAVYLSVPKPIIDYMESRVDECPDFVYYKEPRPSLYLPDLSRKYKGPEQWNCWEADTEVIEYNIGFPEEQEDFFYKMMIEYYCQAYQQKVEREVLAATTKHPLLRVRIRMEDMSNFNSLCLSNNVKFSIDYDKTVSEAEYLVRNPLVLYRAEDREIVNGITTRLARESRGHIPTDSKQSEAAQKNKPKTVENPFIKEV